MFLPSIQPRSVRPWRNAWYQSATSAGEANDRSPIRAIFAVCCAGATSGAMSRLRVSMTMHPAVLYHMVVSFSQPHADLLLSIEAEQLIERQRRRNIQYRWILRLILRL